MTGDYTLHSRQSDAGSGELILRVQPLKDVEQLGRIRHIEPGAIVANMVAHFAAVTSRPEFNSGVGAFRGEYEGVAQQILENDLYQGRVRLYTQSILDSQQNRPGDGEGLVRPAAPRHLPGALR